MAEQPNNCTCSELLHERGLKSVINLFEIPVTSDIFECFRTSHSQNNSVLILIVGLATY